MESVRRYEVYEDRFIESKKKIQKAIEHQRKMNKIREKVEKMVLYLIGYYGMKYLDEKGIQDDE